VATATAKRRSRLQDEHEEHVNHERWLITYADMITLLMVLFIVLYSISQVDLAKFRRLKEGVAGGFGGPAAAGALSGGVGPLQGGGGVFDAGLHGTQAVTSAQAAGLVGQVRTTIERTQLAMWSVKTFPKPSSESLGFGLCVVALTILIASDMVLLLLIRK